MTVWRQPNVNISNHLHIFLYEFADTVFVLEVQFEFPADFFFIVVDQFYDNVLVGVRWCQIVNAIEFTTKRPSCWGRKREYAMFRWLHWSLGCAPLHMGSNCLKASVATDSSWHRWYGWCSSCNSSCMHMVAGTWHMYVFWHVKQMLRDWGLCMLYLTSQRVICELSRTALAVGVIGTTYSIWHRCRMRQQLLASRWIYLHTIWCANLEASASSKPKASSGTLEPGWLQLEKVAVIVGCWGHLAIGPVSWCWCWC